MTHPQVVLHLVHGTWPYGRLAHLARRGGALRRWGWARRRRLAALRAEAWFAPGSRFRAEVTAGLAPAAVRCTAFTWSGDNGFVARAEASRRLQAHLKWWIARVPEAHHVVVAHSHGGTVALGALHDSAGLGLQPPVSGLVTLGTPFVTLAEVPRDAGGAILRSAVFQLAPAMAALAALAAIGAWLLPGGFWGNFLVTAVVLGVIALMLLPKLPKADRLFWFRRDLGALLARQPSPANLHCPLLAIRAPGDEAGLAIAAAQALEWGVTRLWTLPGTLSRWLDTLARALERRGPVVERVALWLGPWAVVIAGVALWDLVVNQAVRGPLALVLAAVLVNVTLLFVVPAVLALAALVTVFGAAAALALATGSEFLGTGGFVVVEAEPVPAGVTAQLAMLPLSEEERQRLALRHSLHQLPAARAVVWRQVAEWLKAPVPARAHGWRAPAAEVG